MPLLPRPASARCRHCAAVAAPPPTAPLPMIGATARLDDAADDLPVRTDHVEVVASCWIVRAGRHAGGEASTESLNPRLVSDRREPWSHRAWQKPKAKQPTAPQGAYAEWRQRAAAVLERRGVSP